MSFYPNFFLVFAMEQRKIIVFCRPIDFQWLGRVSGGRIWDSAKLHPLVVVSYQEQSLKGQAISLTTREFLGIEF